MDNTTPVIPERCITSGGVNGSVRRPSPVPSSCTSPVGGRPASLMDPPPPASTTTQSHIVRVVVNRDDRGYGMKVSGDKPVYVQSVKEGGAAEKAGLHAGDKIIKVNGVNVTQSTHTQVVALIRSSSQVVLTVQQRSTSRLMSSPSLHSRPLTTMATTQITGPQPVDHEKQYQLQKEKEQYYKLMIEKEQIYVDFLRSQIASSPDEKKYSELAKTEKNLQTLQDMLLRSQSEQSPLHRPSTSTPKSQKYSLNYRKSAPINGNIDTQPPPPLPKRNHPPRTTNNNKNKQRSSYMNGKIPIDINKILFNNDNNNMEIVKKQQKVVDILMSSSTDKPPPLPPRNNTLCASTSNNSSTNSAPPLDPDAVNSINKQMSYPLVATCATLVNNYSPNPTHHRTKSSPESLLGINGGEASKRLIASESMNDLSRPDGWDGCVTPPGTPPPPYPSPQCVRKDRNSNNTDGEADIFEENLVDGSSPDISPIRGNGSSRILANSSPIHAANPQTTQQPIISMEDDEISDQEISQLEDHGHFKSLSRLWEHLPHLAVFTNYILSNWNTDPNSLLFYLLTDLYKEGNAKEMRKWAFEIHSCFLVPGAPLRLCNVDENIAREIDDVLLREFDKEEILRKIFWKARSKAKEELTKQLTDFQQKRTAGLGTIFGPTDQTLEEVYHDKVKESRLYESLFLEKWDPYLEDVDKECTDPKRFYTAAAVTTVFTRIFMLRHPNHSLDRCSIFVNKEKSFRTKLMGNKRKLNILGHQFVPQQYYTVITCNYCHSIIYGIGPQGYQCSACHINLHRNCVKLYDDTCPGPIQKKDRGGIGKFIRIRHESNDNRRKQSAHFIQMEKERRHLEDGNSSGFDLNESGEVKTSQPVSRSGSDRRPDSVREENRHQDSPTGGGGGSSGDGLHDENYDKDELTAPDSTTNLPTSSNKRKPTNKINRSESVKEQSTDKSQRKRRHMSGRNISDPSHKNTSGDVDLEHQPGLSNTESGSSSSNVSINGRLSESPSNSFDVGRIIKSESESDMDGELDPLNWQDLVPEEELKSLNVYEKKRQDVINELFMTEGSHVRNLKVLYKIFYKQLLESQTLKTDELNLIFPNIKEMLDIHSEFNKKMRSRRKEDPVVRRCGDMLVEMFDGDCLQRAAATFCERQQLALEFIKDRRKRDNKFDGVLVECEKKRQCRRLQLQGIIPIEMQRLSKYPLLLERLINSVELINNMDDKHNNEDDELGKLRLAHKLSKDVLNYVNEATKLALNKQRLEDIQKHLDLQAFERFDHPIVKDYQNLDLTKFKLVLEGDMQFRRPNKAIVPVHILLLDEAVIILHRENDRYSLKFFQSGSQAQPQPFSPIIKMSTLLVRPNAVCKNGLFLFNTSTVSSQMYDLVVDDDAKRDSWFKHFTEAAENYKIAGKPKRPPTIEPNTETTVETDNNGVDNNVVNNESVSKNETSLIQQQQQESDKDMNSSTPEMISGGGVQTTRVTAEEWPLIQPSQVNVAIPPVHVAEAKLTLIEQIRRKDALIKNTLAEKERMVAELLNIPEEHYSHIVDMATTETTINKDISEQILSVNHQIGKLQLAVNESLNVSEKEAMLAKGGKIQSCTSQQNNDTVKPPSVSTHIVQEAVNLLSLQLTNLWSEMKQIEEERDRFRKELHNIRERFHEENNLHDHLPVNNSQEEDLSPTNDDNPDPETESASTEEQ